MVPETKGLSANERVAKASARADRVALFMHVYGPTLKELHAKNPGHYVWPPEALPEVLKRMAVAFHAGTYHHDGTAIQATCKALGIKHTRKAMEAFFNHKES